MAHSYVIVLVGLLAPESNMTGLLYIHLNDWKFTIEMV